MVILYFVIMSAMKIKTTKTVDELMDMMNDNKKPYAFVDLIEEAEIDGWKFGVITCVQEDSDWGDAMFEAPNGYRGGIVWEVKNTPNAMLDKDFEKDGRLFMWKVDSNPKSEEGLIKIFQTIWVPFLKTMSDHFIKTNC